MKIDSQIIEDCKAGKRSSQNLLYQMLLPYLASVTRRYLWDISYLNDCLQETFIAVFQNLKTYDSQRASFKTWAVKICVNKCFKFNQKSKQKHVTFDADQHSLAVEPDVLAKMTDEEMLKVLKCMPADLYQVFNLVAVDGFNHEETAATLSISTDLSRQRLSRARKWIKEKTNLAGTKAKASNSRVTIEKKL